MRFHQVIKAHSIGHTHIITAIIIAVHTPTFPFMIISSFIICKGGNQIEESFHVFQFHPELNSKCLFASLTESGILRMNTKINVTAILSVNRNSAGTNKSSVRMVALNSAIFSSDSFNSLVVSSGFAFLPLPLLSHRLQKIFQFCNCIFQNNLTCFGIHTFTQPELRFGLQVSQYFYFLSYLFAIFIYFYSFSIVIGTRVADTHSKKAERKAMISSRILYIFFISHLF